MRRIVVEAEVEVLEPVGAQPVVAVELEQLPALAAALRRRERRRRRQEARRLRRGLGDAFLLLIAGGLRRTATHRQPHAAAGTHLRLARPRSMASRNAMPTKSFDPK